MREKLPYIIPLALFLLLVCFTGFAMFKGKTVPQNRLADIPAFSVSGLSDGNLRRKMAVVNFFASWCAPCEAEHSVISALAKKAPVYGINFMDSVEKRERYLKKLGNPYKKIGDDSEGIAAAAWGVEGMPTTFVVRNGHIVYRFDGPLTDELVKSDILPFLEGSP